MVRLLLIMLLAAFAGTAAAQDPAVAAIKENLTRFFAAGRLQEGGYYSDSVRKEIKKHKAEKDTAYPYILYYSAMLFGLQEAYKKCEQTIIEFQEEVGRRYGKNDIKYFSALNLHYLVYHRRKDFLHAQQYLIACREILLHYYQHYESGQVIRTFDAQYDRDDIKFLLDVCCSDLAFSYLHTNEQEKARQYLAERIQYYDSVYVTRVDPQSYLAYEDNYGTYLTFIENLEEAEQTYIRLEAWARNFYGIQHPTYGKVLYDIASFYQTTGDHTKAEKYFLQVKRNLENNFQKESPDYKITLVSLAEIYLNDGKDVQLEALIPALKKALKKENDWAISQYVVGWGFMTTYFINRNKIFEADSMMQVLDRFFKGKDYSYTYTYEYYLNGKAYFSTWKKAYATADSLYTMLIKNMEHNKNTISHKYCTYLLQKEKNLFAWGHEKEAAATVRKGIAATRDVLEKNFRFMSEQQKQAFLRLCTEQFNELNKLALQTKDTSLSRLAFSSQLLIKGLLLKTSVLANREPEQAGSTYHSLFREYLDVRNSIVFQLSRPANQRYGVEDLIQKEDKLEKQLTKLSPEFGERQLNPARSGDIRSALQNGEAAIEFFSYSDHDHEQYGALLLRKDRKEPVAIPLFTSTEFDSAMVQLKRGTREGTINLRYGTESGLFALLWQPMEKYLTNISTVYFAPAGILHKISFAALGTPDGNRLLDKYRLVRLNTTAALADRTPEYLSRNDRLDLYGGVLYDGDTVALRQAAVQYQQNDLASRSLADDMDRGNVYQFLPGTQTEVTSIAQQAQAAGYKVVTHSGWDATEEAIKQATGKNAPEILHIASHGFFFPDPKIKPDHSTAVEGSVFRQSDNPLMRCGIVMAGGNYSWGGHPINGIQDGILTGYEVSNLYLPATRLAVLSACETGLGDIQGSEGVYGLQRAFKIAGVKYLLMSLWDVPDAATAAFMQTFYRKMIGGESIEEAFYHTQVDMEHQFSNEPYKWGAWVLVR